MKSLGAPIETCTGTGYDFYFAAFDQTDLPGIFGDNYAQLSKAMKVVLSKKEEKKQRAEKKSSTLEPDTS